MKNGFSLVELSIVLVILGLLTGGILAGQSLIRAAELRSVSAEYQRFVAAARGFQDKYFALPGDMTNATKFWGAAGGDGTGNDAACNTTASTDAKTCNGNGDRIINTSTGSQETYRFWQHLANAGLIEGSYSGVAGTAPVNAAGVNLPGSRVRSTAVWSPNYNGSSLGGSRFDGEYGNELFVFSWEGAWRGLFKAEEAWNIDTKMDDGKPGAGKLTAPWGTNFTTSGVPCTLAANSADLAANYNLAATTNDCSFWFRQQW